MKNAGLELNMLKTKILSKGVSTVDAYAGTLSHHNTPDAPLNETDNWKQQIPQHSD
jgi:hypothetical protein